MLIIDIIVQSKQEFLNIMKMVKDMVLLMMILKLTYRKQYIIN